MKAFQNLIIYFTAVLVLVSSQAHAVNDAQEMSRTEWQYQILQSMVPLNPRMMAQVSLIGDWSAEEIMKLGGATRNLARHAPLTNETNYGRVLYTLVFEHGEKFAAQTDFYEFHNPAAPSGGLSAQKITVLTIPKNASEKEVAKWIKKHAHPDMFSQPVQGCEPLLTYRTVPL